VVALSNNDGRVIAITPEAKELGFRRGDVYFKREKDFRAAGVAVFSSNYALYGDISRRVARAMESVVPEVYPYSIDEAFIPFDRAMAARAEEIGWALHDRVAKWVGAPTRVGIGPTRTLAKLANHWSKKISRVLALELGSPLLEELLAKTALSDVWGIGRRQAEKLRQRGLSDARDLRDLDPSVARALLTVVGERTVMELRGHQCVVGDLSPVPRQSMVSSRSLGTRVHDEETLAQALCARVTSAAQRLRAEGLLALGLSVFIETGNYAENPFHAGATVTLPSPTNSTLALFKAARAALATAFKPGHAYRKVGIALHELASEEESLQSNPLFAIGAENDPPAVSAPLMGALDRINRKHGAGAIRVSSGGPREPYWATRATRLSPVSTTAWDLLPVARARG
jgi:DNA polymerase V